MVVEPSPHGDFHYAIAAVRRTGKERVHEYAAEDPLRPGDVVRLEGRYWLIAGIEATEGAPARARAKPSRYRLRLRHPDGREEIGVFRRFRPDAPRLGHTFTTLERGQTISWEVVDSRLAEDEEGEPYLDLVAERDYSELEATPDHELEHTVIRDEVELLLGAAAALSRAEEAGLAVELVALEPGEEPDWEAAQRFIEALVIEEVESATDASSPRSGAQTRRPIPRAATAGWFAWSTPRRSEPRASRGSVKQSSEVAPGLPPPPAS